MTTAIISAFAGACLLASPLAHANCSTAFVERFTSAQRIVGSLRPDKPAQARVSASDGSEYTAGEALWMQGRLRSALQACERGEEWSAASRLLSVTDLLNVHHRLP
jgi:hypothetical protein